MDKQVEKELSDMISKVKNGTANKEESLLLMKILNGSMEAFKVLLDEVKIEQTKQELKK